MYFISIACFSLLRRYRMFHSLFLRIANVIEEHDSFLSRCYWTTWVISFAEDHRSISNAHLWSTADATDEIFCIGESTVIKSLERLVKAIVQIFGEEYLRSSNDFDTARLLAIEEIRGFPRMLGTLGWMHWKCKNCPSAWQGMYSGHLHEPIIILEAV